MSAQAQRVQFTTSDYHRMVDAGILAEDDRVELIEGEILRVEVHRDPQGDGYRDVTEKRRGDSLAPRAFPDLVFEVETIVR